MPVVARKLGYVLSKAVNLAQIWSLGACGDYDARASFNQFFMTLISSYFPVPGQDQQPETDLMTFHVSPIPDKPGTTMYDYRFLKDSGKVC